MLVVASCTLNMGFQCINFKINIFFIGETGTAFCPSLEMLTPDIDILSIHQIRGKYRQLSPELRRYIEANRLPQIYCVHYS